MDREAVLQALSEHHVITAKELAEQFDVTRTTSNRWLKELSEDPTVHHKDVGSSATVWWIEDDTGDTTPELSTEDHVEAVMEAHDVGDIPEGVVVGHPQAGHVKYVRVSDGVRKT